MFTASPAAWIFVAYLQKRPSATPTPTPHAHVAFTSRPPWHQGIGYLTRTACLKFWNTQIVGKLNENILRLAFDWGIRNGGGWLRGEGECWGCKLLCGIKTAASSGQQTAERQAKNSAGQSCRLVAACQFFFLLFSIGATYLPPFLIPNQDV